MHPYNRTRRLAVTGLCTLAAGIAAAPSAQAASVNVNLVPGLPGIAVDTDSVQGAVSGIRSAAVQKVQTTLRQANNGVVAPTASTVQRVLRQAGATTYVVVDGSGRVLRGPGVVSVHTTRGLLAVGWTNDLKGCLQVALSNTLAPQSLQLDLAMPLTTRVTSGSGRARASLRNVSLAVIC